MNFTHTALQWAKDYLLKNHKLLTTECVQVVDASHSSIFRIAAGGNTFYLKCIPQELYIETTILKFFKQQGIGCVPEVYAMNDTQNCFLMPASGSSTLRTLFTNNFQLKLFEQGIKSYTFLQRKLENHVDELLGIGVRDWRLDKFPMLYRQLLEQESMLKSDGLSGDEINKLQLLEPSVTALCKKLAYYKIPDTINHADFQENNILVDTDTGAISIIDWGECTISHPFFSLNGAIWNLQHFFPKICEDDLLHKLKKFCINDWRSDYEEGDLLEAFEVANQLLGIYAGLGYQYLYQITAHNEKSVQKAHPGSVAGCLRTFMNSVC